MKSNSKAMFAKENLSQVEDYHSLDFKMERKKLFPFPSAFLSGKQNVNNLHSNRKPLKSKFGLNRWQGIDIFHITHLRSLFSIYNESICSIH